LKYVLDIDTDKNTLELIMRLRQATEEKRASSSRRPINKERFIRREREEVHERLYKDYFAEHSIFNETHF